MCLARVIYGFRISVLFGLILTAGVGSDRRRGRGGAGLFWRLDRSHPAALHRNLVVVAVLYLLLIISAILPPGFWVLLGIMLLFSWVGFCRHCARRISARAQF